MNFRYVLLLLIFSLPIHAETINPNSIYQFNSQWQDQNAQRVELSSLQGTPQLVAFVYTYCEHTCPLIIAQIKSLLNELPEPTRQAIQVSLVSLDPERDQPPQLKAYMQKHQLNETQWTMLNGHPDDVRVLSTLFNVQYKPMQADQLAHSNIISLLDKEGVLKTQLLGLNEDKAKLIEQINALL